MDRYHRQTLLPQIGPDGQARLGASRVLLVGCGALGCVIADQLVRAGVGTLFVADRDVVELTNLQRQVLFDEQDVKEGLPKAVAAARRLGQINSQVKVEPLLCDVHAENVEDLAGVGTGRTVDLILDGTDSIETRYLLNDVSVKHSVPWVYGACVGVEGRVMAIRPRRTACLRCVFPEPPAPSELPTCDTAGVLGPLAAVVGAVQATIAIKLLVGVEPAIEILRIDMWRGTFRSIDLSEAKRVECPVCGARRFDRLERRDGHSTSLCGREAVQVRPQSSMPVNFEVLEARLAGAGAVERTAHLLRCNLHSSKGLRITIFGDGRAIIHGTTNPDRARALYARYIGL